MSVENKQKKTRLEAEKFIDKNDHDYTKTRFTLYVNDKLLLQTTDGFYAMQCFINHTTNL